jgi:hypothetical protein
MSAFADLIGSKEFLAALAVLAVGGVFTAAIKWYRDNRDGKKIYTFLLQSKTGTGNLIPHENIRKQGRSNLQQTSKD